MLATASKSAMATALPQKSPPPKLRAVDIAYDAIESMIVTLQLKPGSPIVESELIEITGLGRTPLREALMRMSSNGLILQLPRRGLIVSDIEAAEHMTLIETRRVIERLIATSAARRSTPQHRKDMVECADQMLVAAKFADLGAYMAADQALDHVIHEACRNPSAVAAVVPLVIKCRRFWYAFQHEGDIEEGARCHLMLAKAIAKGNEEQALKATDSLMDYLESFARKIING
ncbi:GntR family transcriptional regulator [Undibacterium sp. RTI2.1]|uniref:GntR family transcriptional regulator n=1 Tax=unclassified Undibacterium TaxID=2630295 RepID=UPI002AB58A61|nr:MULTISPECIES: GntR family transcriptional regulator [unclassified Undibacterium]MDY7538721.1 GntR family transcriptional regulator [Undibacterium sp. 5I1]MEB0030223.1 GntR family transcriptional regulator [Undibacterium sp. RTI2.1]MEB0116847.1 GntR family transcriptional regulator [Undibacterium sp. RTI2.2]MEB0229660.1 GntR family transcriptional regulator [Undibacterium sp. 10I3]MEB0259349.1 GntR family transcriptional regulator [Undibacterium sp. 5I1]